MNKFHKSLRILKNTNKAQKKFLLVIALIIVTISMIIGRTTNQIILKWKIEGEAGTSFNKTESELLAELQELTEASRFRIKVNTQPVMEQTTGATSVIVQNSVENKFNKKVIYVDLEGNIVYETPMLYPGDNLLNVEIPGDWAIGTYTLNAHVLAIDVVTQEEFIVTELEINLNVK